MNRNVVSVLLFSLFFSTCKFTYIVNKFGMVLHHYFCCFLH